MEFVSPALEIAKSLWRSTRKRAVLLLDLTENLASLEAEMDRLKNLREDVKRRVEQEEERHQMKRTNQVDGWLHKVEEMEAEASQVLQQGKEEDQRKCFRGCCPRNCWSSYKLGKKVSKMIDKVGKLCSEACFDVLAHKLPRSPVDEMPMDKTVGSDLMFEKVWKSIEDRSVGIIGLFGIGGVGKTTLLKGINNEFLNSDHGYSVVIWAVISKQVNLEKVQEIIRNKLEIPDSLWEKRNEDERAAEIYRVLRRKKFVLLLDDIWERFDLTKAGVPRPDDQNESKVIFTTRSEEVCGRMEADRRIRVECLARDEALNLFRKMVGEETLNSHQEIPRLAEAVAERCEGLPLALITTGRAMACRKDPREWKHAIKTLASYPSTFAGMRDHVFPVLKFSYDSLSDETTKVCFLYCSLFPEDHYIPKEELINLWIGEGFLDKFDDVSDARNEGEHIIGSLKLACLIESCETEYVGYFEDYVRMHDVIRDMALWLANEQGKKESKFLVREAPCLIGADCEQVERMSCWGPDLPANVTVNIMFMLKKPFSEVKGVLFCPNLRTLLFKNSYVVMIPSGFLQYVPALSVLDLSRNSELAALPEEIGELINLHYLNLSWTAIAQIPVEIKNLKKLRSLILDDTRYLQVIPREVIPKLASLQVFSKLAMVDFSYMEDFDVIALLEDLECLERINDIAIHLTTPGSVQKLLSSPKLQRCMRRLEFMECPEMVSLNIPSSCLRRMENVERLDIKYCHDLTELKVHQEDEDRLQEELVPDSAVSNSNLVGNRYFRCLRHAYIKLGAMKDFTWLVYAPTLQILELFNCHSAEKVVSEDYRNVRLEANRVMFPSLMELYLVKLPNLNFISQKALSFPCLKTIYVSECPQLRNLPFDSNSECKSLKTIKGEESWWEGLQWENEQVKHAFSSKYVAWKYPLLG